MIFREGRSWERQLELAADDRRGGELTGLVNCPVDLRWSITSQTVGSASTPNSVNSSASASNSLRRRATSATFVPWLANIVATSRAIPLDAPVGP